MSILRSSLIFSTMTMSIMLTTTLLVSSCRLSSSFAFRFLVKSKSPSVFIHTSTSTKGLLSHRNIRPFVPSSSFSSSSLAAATDADAGADSIIPAGTYTATKLDEPSKSSNTSRRDMQQVITTIELAARKAGVIMQQTAGKIAVQKTKMNTSDLVTASDIECQRVIQETIQSSFPNDDFLGEEDVDAGSLASSTALKSAIAMNNDTSDNDSDGASVSKGENKDEDEEGGKLLFIVDPIDGTTNFQAGLPMFCVSIGVVSLENENEDNDNEPVVVAGVIYNPILNEMVSAVKSRGCYMNGTRLDPKIGPSELNQALINVGFPVTSEATLKASSTAVAALATSVRGLRMIASASQVMSWVAQGKLSAYVSWDLNAWDVAAGMVIVEESGGFVSNFDGERADITTRDMIVTCKEAGGERKLTEDIRSILKNSGCLEY